MSAPSISAQELASVAKELFPSALIAYKPINPDYGSWRLEIGGRSETQWLEFSWGPLSGFGATDMKEDLGDDAADIFAPYAVSLDSFEAAKTWLHSKKKEEPNQPLQRNASKGSVSNFQSPARRG